MCLVGGGCDGTIRIQNAAPSVTWLAVQPPQQGVSRVTIWVSDLDGDSVDLEVTWRAEGESDDHIASFAPGGHGLVGLTTRDAIFDENGQGHELLWEMEDVPLDQSVRLTFTPNDRNAGVGASGTSPPFTAQEGLPDPVALSTE